MDNMAAQQNVTHIDFAALKLRAGTWLKVQSMEGDSRKFEVEFAAVLQRKMIFVAIPERAAGNIQIKSGERYLVSGFNGMCEFAFTSIVTDIQTMPFVHAQLTYPDSVESKVVREVLRVRASLPATVTLAGVNQPIAVKVEDLSVAGALLESATPLGMIGDRIQIRISIRVDGKETELTMPAVMRHVGKLDSTGISRNGIEFVDIAQSDKFILYYLLFTLGGEGA